MDIDEALNILQVQLALSFIHSSQLFFIDCDYPKAPACLIAVYAAVFFFLFANYYQKAYKKEKVNKVRTGLLYYKLMFLGGFHCSVAQTAVHSVTCYCGYPALFGIAKCSGYRFQNGVKLQFVCLMEIGFEKGI
jgi:hypothetical protein